MKPFLKNITTGILPFGPSQGSLMLNFVFGECDSENHITEDSDILGTQLFSQTLEKIKENKLEGIFDKYLYSGQYGDTLQGLFTGRCIPKYIKTFESFFNQISKASLEKQRGQGIKFLRPPFTIYNGGCDFSNILDI